jgi:plastocyanin
LTTVNTTATTAATATTSLPNYGGAIIPANEGQSPTEIWLDNYEARPNALVVTKGTTVTWVNHDYWKPLTVVSDDGLFAANVEPTNGTFSYLFDTAGSFGYSIDPYSGVWQGVVIVVE